MNPKPQYSLRTLVLLVPVWTLLWVAVHAVILHRFDLDWGHSVADAFLFNLVIGLGAMSGVLFNKFYRQGSFHLVYMVLFSALASAACGSVFNVVACELFASHPAYMQLLLKSDVIRWMLAFLIILFVMVLNWMWTGLREEQIKSNRQSEAGQLVKEAELVMLRQQLQPHFLFNSLNSINALIGAEPALARKMIQQLSDFLRGTLKKDEQQFVELREEWEHLKLYLEIEKVRFGDRLNIELSLPDEVATYKLPTLILQPLVENAIKFGLYGTTSDITITIKAEIQGAMLMVEIINPYEEDSQASVRGTGFGLNSVQRRLYLLFSRNDLLNTRKNDKLFVTELKIPTLKQPLGAA